jgi:hypothetical protein
MEPERREYFDFHTFPFLIEYDRDGNRRGFSLSRQTGEFERDDSRIWRALNPRAGEEIDAVDEDGFIRLAEEERAHRFVGDGPIFALYDATTTLRARAMAEGRRLSRHEIEVIGLIHRRTFAMWEDETARRARGEKPTFTARPRSSAAGSW